MTKVTKKEINLLKNQLGEKEVKFLKMWYNRKPWYELDDYCKAIIKDFKESENAKKYGIETPLEHIRALMAAIEDWNKNVKKSFGDN